MIFKCQSDSFLREYETIVTSCVKSISQIPIPGTNEKIDGFELILEDTILFPEGGGQPCDYGLINNERVYQVTRRGRDAVHLVTKSFSVGDRVLQKVDWDRRLDHMQQHSGQHLITAIIDRDYGFNTSSWWLGEDVSHIELDTPELTAEQIAKTENICNELIRKATPVTVSVHKNFSKEAIEEDKENNSDVIIDVARTRGLPDDHEGDIRVVTIHGIESNMCCGTHVTNLSQLQVIKLLHTEKGKRKDKTLLHFWVGNRVLKNLQVRLEREQKLTVLLKNNPVQHADLVDRLQKNFKVTSKNLQIVLKEIAVNEAEKLKAISPKPLYYCLHRKEADADFMSIFVKEYGASDIFLFLSVGDEKTTGNILLYGPESAVVELGPKISEILNGKGAGKGNRYQAKVNEMVNRKKCIELIKEYFKQ